MEHPPGRFPGQGAAGEGLDHSDLPQHRLCGHQEQSKADGSIISSILVPELGRTGMAACHHL